MRCHALSLLLSNHIISAASAEWQCTGIEVTMSQTLRSRQRLRTALTHPARHHRGHNASFTAFHAGGQMRSIHMHPTTCIRRARSTCTQMALRFNCPQVSDAARATMIEDGSVDLKKSRMIARVKSVFFSSQWCNVELVKSTFRWAMYAAIRLTYHAESEAM